MENTRKGLNTEEMEQVNGGSFWDELKLGFRVFGSGVEHIMDTLSEGCYQGGIS